MVLLLILFVHPWASRSPSSEASPEASPPSFASPFSNSLQVPVKPLVELTVCPEGPPVCQFSKIQEAIEAAPETPPVTTWQFPPEIPLIRIAPGLYEERLVILKNVWLKGADHDSVTLRRPEKLQDPVVVFVAGSHYSAMILQDVTIEGRVKVVGSTSGLFSNNIFRPDPTGNSGVQLSGELSVGFVGNVFLDAPISLYPVAPLFLPGDPKGPDTSGDSVVMLFNQLVSSKRERVAIYIHQSSHVGINSNSIQGFLEGILLVGGEEIEIVANTLKDNSVGIVSCCSDNVEIRMNKLEGHSYAALRLSTSSRGRYLVATNQITRNNRGIEWGSLAQMQIMSNTVTQNEVGLQLWPFTPSQDADKILENLKVCRNNKIFENNTDYVIVGISPEPLRQRCEGE